MDTAEFRKTLETWDLPLGPFREPEDIVNEMRETAIEMGPAAASALAELATAIDRDRLPNRQVFIEFMNYYAKAFPEELASALSDRLSADGPPLPVLILGSTGSGTASSRLLSVLNLETADDDLLEALASTLGELGDVRAIEALRALGKRDDLSERVRNEINIALWNDSGQT